jgi:hypothetical protein
MSIHHAYTFTPEETDDSVVERLLQLLRQFGRADHDDGVHSVNLNCGVGKNAPNMNDLLVNAG